MRILVHDYSGHPFQLQLSRWFAGVGHRVLHLYSSDIETPRGAVSRRGDDAGDFAVESVGSGVPLPKYDLARRWWRERDYARRLVARARAFRPDAVLATGPPTIQSALSRATSAMGSPYVCWLQDIYGIAAAHFLERRIPGLGRFVAAAVTAGENAFLRRCDGIVAITEDFRPALRRAGVSDARVAVIPNWAPVDEIVPAPRHSVWAETHGLVGRFVFLYAGTLGLKHDPGRLVDLATAFRDDPAVRVVVVSQGPGRRLLEAAKQRSGIGNLLLLDYRPYERLSETLGAADVAVALLEPFASGLSVPSKVMSYLCAGKPVLGAMPVDNLASRTILDAGAGLVASPDDRDGFLAAARRLRADEHARAAMGAAARRTAERAFDIDAIGARFLEVLDSARRRVS